MQPLPLPYTDPERAGGAALLDGACDLGYVLFATHWWIVYILAPLSAVGYSTGANTDRRRSVLAPTLIRTLIKLCISTEQHPGANTSGSHGNTAALWK